MIVGDELVTNDARLAGRRRGRDPPVISAAACDPGRSSARTVADEVPRVPRAGRHRRPPPQRELLPRALRRALRGAGAARDPPLRDDAAGRTDRSSPCRAARTRSRSGICSSRSATRPTASTSASASTTTPTSRHEYARAFADVPRPHAARRRPRDGARLHDPGRGRGHPARALRRVRALEAARVQLRSRSSTATTSSRPVTTSTTRPPCCSATCCAGTSTTSPASIRCSRPPTGSRAR